jgi:hypothetical protein
MAPTATVMPSATVSAIRFIGDGNAADPMADLRHQNDKTDDRPKYVDIESIDATADGLNLDLGMTLRAEPPATRSNSIERLRYYFALDTTGDGVIDFLLELENYGDSTYHPVVEDWTGLEPVPQATLAMTIDGRRVIASLPLASLRSPTSLQFCAFAMSAVPGGDAVFVKDYAPDGFCEGAGADAERHLLALT